MKWAATQFTICIVLTLCHPIPAKGSLAPDWTRSAGAHRLARGNSVATDSAGSVFLSGDTLDALASPNAGDNDAFVYKFDGTGVFQWARQIGTKFGDSGVGVAVGLNDSVFLGGDTRGSLAAANAGQTDPYIAKYDASGSLQWAKQFGTYEYDNAEEIATDHSGNVYLVGDTSGKLGAAEFGSQDAFIIKLNSDGEHLWTSQFGSNFTDFARAVCSDSLGNLYVSGFTEGSLAAPGAAKGSFDAFLSKLDANGSLLWTRQLGTSGNDGASGVAVDELGHVYISGFTDHSLAGSNLGGFDAFVSQYDSSGNLNWTRQLGTELDNSAESIGVDAAGNAYVVGNTDGLRGTPNEQLNDTFLAKLTPAGVIDFAEFFETGELDRFRDVSVGKQGVFVASMAEGQAVHTDAFVLKFNIPVPEPESHLLLGIATIVLAWRRSAARLC